MFKGKTWGGEGFKSVIMIVYYIVLKVIVFKKNVVIVFKKKNIFV